MKTYTVTTDKPTAGPWRESATGNRYASVRFHDGRSFYVGVERVKRVRIPYKPRGQNIGWTYAGFVNDGAGERIMTDKVAGSIGVRGLLKIAGLVPPSDRQVRAYNAITDLRARLGGMFGGGE